MDEGAAYERDEERDDIGVLGSGYVGYACYPATF